MRLHRLDLTDYRGIAHRSIRFAETGITVVKGPNEIGKSSLLEALDLILTTKASSKNQTVRDVQPAGRDVGPLVEVELSSGPYHFVYTKQWLRGVRTELSLRAPVREQQVGDAAHDRVVQILAETLDADLWHAVRLLQGRSLEQADLTTVTPLHRALEATSDGGEVGGDHADLLERIGQERDAFFTKSGAERGELLAAGQAVAEAERRREEARESLAGIDQLVRAHADRERELSGLRVGYDEASAERADARRLRREVEALSQALQNAQAAEREARLRVEAAVAQRDARRHVVAEVERRAATLSAARAAQEAAAANEAEIAERLAEAESGASSARSDTQDLRAAWSLAEEAAAARRAAREAEGLAERLGRVDEASTRLAEIAAALTHNRLDEAALNRIQDAHSEERALRESARAGAPVVQVEPLGTGVVLVDGVSADGVRQAVEATHDVTVEVPETVRVTVVPDRGSIDRAEAATAAQAHVAGLLAEHGVADLDAARARRSEQQRLTDQRREIMTRREAALDGLTREELVARRDAATRAAQAQPEGAVPAADSDELRDRFEHADREATRLQHELERSRVSRDEARQGLIKAEAAFESADGEFASVRSRLETMRAEIDDQEVEAQVASAEERRADAAGRVTESERALREAGAEGLAERVAGAEKRVADLDAQVRGLEDHVRDLATRLQTLGEQGWHDRLTAAEASLADATRARERLAARADAARLLHEVMERHHREAQRRYVAPFTRAIESLGRIVFEDDFTVEISEELRIVSRTLDGVTVPFGSLSGGAREQLALLGRLAAARLVEAAEGAPVIIDDALGFADAERRRSMAAVLSLVARDAQVIVLTCEPDRYRDVEVAATVRLDGASLPAGP